MKGNFSVDSRAFGGKPVINEPLGRTQVAETRGRPVFVPTVMPGKKASEAIGPDELRLREGTRLFNAGRWDDALQELLFVDVSALRIKEKIELSYYMGLCFTKLKKMTEALPYLEKVVAASDEPLRVCQCRMTLAYIHVVTGRPKMAEFELGRLLEVGFESAQLFNTMAHASYSRKHYRHAIEYYEKALKLEQNNATALNSMGYILVDTGIDPLKGLRFCRKAVEMQPSNAAYLDSLGWACYKCKEPMAARDWLRKALEIAPQETMIKEHLRIVTGGVV